MPLSTYAQSLMQTYDYSGILPPSDFPTAQFYPNITPLLPSIVSFLNQAQPILEQSAQSSSFPSSLSYGQIEALATQGQAIWSQLDALSPAPVIFNSEFGDVVIALQTLLIYPELMSK